jgi:hypothetical protein
MPSSDAVRRGSEHDVIRNEKDVHRNISDF